LAGEIAAPVSGSHTQPLLRSGNPLVNGRPGSPTLPPSDSPSDDADALKRAQPEPPAQPSEFQRFVFTATGRALPVFGERYFTAPSATFLPPERTPVPADYVIGPGDEIVLRGWGSVDIDVRAVVDRRGRIDIPRVGLVSVAGQPASRLQEHVRSRVARVFKGFDLDVSLGQLRAVQVFVVGHARRPGTYTVSSQSTLINAVFASGGPGPDGSMRRVQVRRGDAVVGEIDLYRFIVEGSRSGDVRLHNGDVVVFPAAGARAAVIGAVDTPAVYELHPSGTPLADLLRLAGGDRAHADAQALQLERVDRSQPLAPRRVVRVDPAIATSTLAADGDIVTVQSVRPNFANAVTLRGNVAQPLRYPHEPGMRITDLIPDRDALVTRDYHLRKNRLVQYLEAQAEPAARARRPGEDEPSPNPFRADPDEQTARLLTEREPKPIGRVDGAESILRNLVDEPNWDYATIERLDRDRIVTQLIPFNLGRAILARDPAHNLLLQPGDVVTVFGSRDLRRPQERVARLVRVEGEVERPGIYQLQAGESLRALLARAGGVTPQAYLFGLEFSRRSTRDRQTKALEDVTRRLEAALSAGGSRQLANLGNADAATVARLQAAEEEARKAQLERLRSLKPNGRIALELHPSIRHSDDLPDLPLEDGDAVLVPPRPGYVFAAGAVANENALIWRAGRKVDDYLNVAGVTPEADEKNIFVVRADGSVVHARQSRGTFFGSGVLASLELAPGDTIVVPELTDRETPWNAFIRGAKDWSQILSNFGIAAAAIKTLSN
jgi:protein involved in polysaccharide export with SLBB domain